MDNIELKFRYTKQAHPLLVLPVGDKSKIRDRIGLLVRNLP